MIDINDISDGIQRTVYREIEKEHSDDPLKGLNEIARRAYAASVQAREAANDAEKAARERNLKAAEAAVEIANRAFHHAQLMKHALEEMTLSKEAEEKNSNEIRNISDGILYDVRRATQAKEAASVHATLCRGLMMTERSMSMETESTSRDIRMKESRLRGG